MIIYSAEWIEDDEYAEYEVRYFETLRAAQNFARRKSSKVFCSTYAVESEAENASEDKSFLSFLVGAFGGLGFWVALWILAFILYSIGGSQ